ncbi:MAG TPA: glycerophosphodiester phosphodiesterase [Candidatus Udaeobacter sp.]|nr:glycerophosphodiester phosphodiesterase [Candidatus Udaeobacter sp.]
MISAHDGFPRWAGAGADFLEIDVRQASDGVFILSHDEPAEDAAVPGLEEALGTGCPLQLDLKEAGFEPELILYVLERLPAEKLAVTTGIDGSIKTVKESFPDVRAGLTLAEELTESTWRRIEDCHADFVALDHRFAGSYARRPVRVWLWTVDDELQLERYLEDGWPEAIITNRPDLALRLRARVM